MFEHHLTTDDMPLFTRLRMTAFGEAVIDIANDPACDEWTFSQKIRHALDKEGAARSERRMLKLLKASRTPNGICQGGWGRWVLGGELYLVG